MTTTLANRCSFASGPQEKGAARMHAVRPDATCPALYRNTAVAYIVSGLVHAVLFHSLAICR